MIDDLISYHHVGPIVSSLLMDVLGTFGFAAIVASTLVLRARKLREALAADASAGINPRHAPGRAVVCGLVEYAQGSLQAVRVNIEQDGDESETSGVWSHKWTEKNRRVNVEPFYLRIDDDKRIRVEPNNKVFLVDDMDGLIRVDLTKRVKFAELTPGERVYASGELVRAHDPEATTEKDGYRNAHKSLVLRPLAGETMLLSSEPLGARYRARAAFYAKAARRIVTAALLFHVIFGGFHLRRYLGETVAFPISKLDQYTTQDDEGRVTYHYRVYAIAPGRSVWDEVDDDSYRRLRVGDVVPFRLVSGVFSERSTIGPDVTAPIYAWLIVPLLVITWFVYKHREKKSQPWYDHEVVDTGKGRLEETLAKEREASARRS